MNSPRLFSLRTRFYFAFGIGLFLLGWVYIISKVHFEDTKGKVGRIASQELRINKHLFVVSDIQTRINQAVEEIIEDIESFKEGKLSADSLKDRILVRSPYIEREVERGFKQYRDMKDSIFTDLEGAEVAKLSVDLYINEFRFFESKNLEAYHLALDQGVNEELITQYEGIYTSAKRSLDIIVSSYLREIETISTSAQRTILEGQQRQWELIQYAILSFLFVLFTVGLIIHKSILSPLKVGIKMAHRIANGNRDLEDIRETPDEMGDLLHALKDMAAHIKKHEDQLVQEKSTALEENYKKGELLATIDSELSRPLEIVNKALHEAHEDKNISSKNKELIEIAEHESEHIGELLGHVKQLAGVEHKTDFVKYEEVNFRNFLEDISRTFIKTIKAHYTTFYMQVSPSIEETILVDKEKFSDILQFCLSQMIDVTRGGIIRTIVDRIEQDGNKEDYLYINISEEIENKLGPFPSEADKRLVEKTNIMVLKEIESADYSIYKNIVNSLGGTLEIKRVSENESEIRLIIPLFEVHDEKEQTIRA